MKRPIILFSSSSLYLTHPQFRSIIPLLNEYSNVLFNVNEPASHQVDNDYINSKNSSVDFDSYLKLPLKIKVPFRNFNSYIKYKRILIHYLHKINPVAIISGSDLSVSDRVLSSWCYKRNIPFIILQPSFIDGFPAKRGLKQFINYFVLNRILNLPIFEKFNFYGNVSSKSYLFLWSKYFIKNRKRGNSFFLGNPAFDKLFLKFDTNRSRKNTVLICTDNLPLVIFGEELLRKLNSIIKHAITSNPNLKFIIKVHPRESIEKYKKLYLANSFPNLQITKQGNLYDLFSKCDLQISVVSFTSFEAAAVGIPIITIRPDNIFVIDHFKEKIDVRATNKEEIINAINLCLSDNYWEIFLAKRKKYFRGILSFTDGRSSSRVAKTINQIIIKHYR